MKLTRFTDYSLRVLIYLGLREDEMVTIREVSDAYGISRNHLMKVVSLLTRMGYLNARRGPGGGITLARAPGDIIVGNVIRDMEDDLNLVECFRENGECVIQPMCQLKVALNNALDAYLETLDRVTLLDLIRPRQQLSEALEMKNITPV